MNEDKYLAESAGFDGDAFHLELIPPQEVEALLWAVSAATTWADMVKRSLFYGATPKLRTGQSGVALPTSIELSPEDRDLVHAILGLFSEAGELMQHLGDVLNGRSGMDSINVLEELGDCYWYAAILHRMTGTKFSDAMRANIAKLAARYPERHSEYRALNRDLDAERQVLEEQLGRGDA